MRALFLDLNAVTNPAKMDALWEGEPGPDPARDVFLASLDLECVERLNRVVLETERACGERPVLVVASLWRLVWSVPEIAAMLLERGLADVKFSGTRVQRDRGPLAGVREWLGTHDPEAWAVVGGDEVEAELAAHVASYGALGDAGVRRAVALLANRLS